MQLDTINKADAATGKVVDIKLPAVKAAADRLTDAERQYYENFAQPDFNTPVPFSQGPRRMGIDKDADVAWVGNSWGGIDHPDRHPYARNHVRAAALSGHGALPDRGRQEP